LTPAQKQLRETVIPSPEPTRLLEETPIGVGSIILTVSRKGGAENYSTPLARFKTAKGIGLGSTVKQITKAYPRVKPTRGAVQKRTGTVWYILAGSTVYGKTQTVFNVARGGRVNEIMTRNTFG
jgi:hypothetical protein